MIDCVNESAQHVRVVTTYETELSKIRVGSPLSSSSWKFEVDSRAAKRGGAP
jgi:hypothetical protein